MSDHFDRKRKTSDLVYLMDPTFCLLNFSLKCEIEEIVIEKKQNLTDVGTQSICLKE